MTKIRVLETFSGIGAQHKAISNLNKNNSVKFKVVGTVEWDARAIIAYSAIHHNLFKNYKKIIAKHNLTNHDQVNSFLEQFVISLDSKKPSQIIRKDLFFKQVLASAIISANNLGDIINLDVNKVANLKPDLITYSFPCQGLSVANMGRAKGILDQNSTSSLVWNIYKLLAQLKTKPKYLLMENVKNLISKKFLPQYKIWLKNLEELGYQTFTAVLNGINCGSIQKHERVFALSFYKPKKLPFTNNKEFQRYLDDLASEKKLDLIQRKKVFEHIFDFSKDNKENQEALINKTPSRIRIIEKSKHIHNSNNFIINTVTTKQDRIPSTGVIKSENSLKNKLNYRFITPRESFLLMGFRNQDFDKMNYFIENKIINRESLYRQAGNSIVVQVIEHLFQTIINLETGNTIVKKTKAIKKDIPCL
ncbi:Cytosine-specific DNA methyltransferase/Type II site-specific deoxyribonuclease [Mesomycoplasma conjunctivae]|nr:Cytosine-specific DNA methyltransferase/Type II site-specific deoxyribonuclease [Mesomycoplasma conjunctivae]